VGELVDGVTGACVGEGVARELTTVGAVLGGDSAVNGRNVVCGVGV
jgi:hypothetical protein